MASEIFREKVIGNFKPPKAKKHKNSRWRQDRPGMSDKHLAAVRKLPCTICLKMPAGTVHHLKSNTGERGMSVRSTDQWGVPMCMIHHEEVERAGTKNEVAYFGQVNLDPHELAQALWKIGPDLSMMTKVFVAHRLKYDVVDAKAKKD
jgi:hypothetical protein